MTNDNDIAPDKGAPRAGTARARAGIDEARRKAGAVIAATRDKGEAVIDETREKGYRAAAETNRLFQEHPVAAVAAAAAAGAILAIFMPRLAITARAGQLAGRAVRAAAASEVAKVAVTGMKQGSNAALRGIAGKAAVAMGSRLPGRRKAPATAADAPRDDIADPAPDRES